MAEAQAAVLSHDVIIRLEVKHQKWWNRRIERARSMVSYCAIWSCLPLYLPYVREINL